MGLEKGGDCDPREETGQALFIISDIVQESIWNLFLHICYDVLTKTLLRFVSSFRMA